MSAACLRCAALLLLLAPCAALLRPHLAPLHPRLAPLPLRPAPRIARATAAVARYEDDSWLTGGARLPFSGESLEVLFRYGPVIYASRCFDSEQYNASVRDFMYRYPRISRALAEQEIHEYLSDSNGYMARTTAASYPGPKDEDLKPPGKKGTDKPA